MPRPKKENYEYIPSKGLYRKRVTDLDGKRRALYGKTPEELSGVIAAFRQEMELERIERKNPYVNAAIQRWMDKELGGISKETRRRYQSAVNCHIKPYMEGLRMLDVYPMKITEIIAHVANKSEGVHNTTFMLLKRFFTSAFENGDIPFNPCPKMHNGGRAPKEKVALTFEQQKVLLDAVKGTPAYLFCMIALYAGLRTEEIYGLAWDCVHLEDTPYIQVKRACRWDHCKAVVTERLKSKAARRDIPIPPVLVECLREAQVKSKSDFVFSDGKGGTITQCQAISLWKNVVRRSTKERTYVRYKNGQKTTHVIRPQLGEVARRGGFRYTIDFEVTPHILRHTYITNLLLGGVDIKSAQYLAGHEKSKLTLDIYTHLMYHKPEDLMREVSKAFGRAPVKQEPAA